MRYVRPRRADLTARWVADERGRLLRFLGGTAAGLLAFALGCASQGAPPGGAPDSTPPEVLHITPDTGAVNVKPPRVVFRFDEVVSERPQGVTSLRDLFVISPRAGEPDVDWHRDVITVRARRGWRTNTVYTVTMLPGLSDLRGNVRKDGAVALFSTGATVPSTRITGIVFDWAVGNPAPRSFVEAISRPDSANVYVAPADSTGRFAFRHLPAGTYTVRGYIDANNNRELDPREAWDSVHVTLRDSAAAEILAFGHDTVGPAVSDVDVRDSVTLRLTLDRPLDPAQLVAPALFALVGADSAQVPIRSAVRAAVYDSLVQQRAAQDTTGGARADTARAPAAPAPSPAPRPGARPDTAPVPRGPLPSRPAPPKALVLEMGRPLRPSTTYRLRTIGLRGLLGVTRSAERAFTTPKPGAAADSAGAAPTDSAGRRPVARPGARPSVRPATPPVRPARPDTARRTPPR